MRRVILLCILGVAVVLTGNSHSEACRHRARRCSYSSWSYCYPSGVRAPVATQSATVPPWTRARVVSAKLFTSPKGRSYRILQTGEMDTHEEAQVQIPPLTAAAAGPDRFLGKDRKVSKTSIAPGAVETFADIAALRTTLAPDEEMVHAPGISEAEDNQRTDREKRNVKVRAYLLAAGKEKDNDFHLILGFADAADTGAMLNSEVSGLPDGGPFAAPLKMVRDQFKEHFGSNLPARTYDIYDPPIPVEVTGSLFFDLDHRGGTIGPGTYKPSTAWEIHPITNIVFEP